MRNRGAGEIGLGWIDVGAILFVIAVLAYSFSEIATGRLQELAKEASRVASAVSETVDTEAPAGDERRAGDQG